MDFGHRCKVMRAARRLSQKELADALGVNRVFLWQIENGNLPRPEMMDKIKYLLAWGADEDAALDALAQEGGQ